MADRDIFTENYDRYNTVQNKKISMVFCIEGVSIKFSNRPIFSRIRYGEEFKYGTSSIKYGVGLKNRDDIRDIISFEGTTLTIRQKIEPEQAKGSTTLFNVALVDNPPENIVTQIISPGVIVDDVIGKRVTIELGYEQISYPQDYFVVFRGKVTGLDEQAGKVIIQCSDANFSRRQRLFFTAKTTLAGAITSGATTIAVAAAGDFHKEILGPLGTFDDAINLYFKIEDEFIEYPSGQPTVNDFIGVTRGARGTTAAAHDDAKEVTAFVEIEDHAIDMALKLMLSGWNGPWLSDVPIFSLEAPNIIRFTAETDVKRIYGLTTGEFITVSGSAIPANNAQFSILEIQSPNDIDKNTVVIVDGVIADDNPSTALVAFRSQFDTYPTSCGLKLTPQDVDIDGHIEIKNVFLGDAENSYRFLIGNEEASGKNFIEKEVYLPVALYSITELGKLNCEITKPPLADENLSILTNQNILQPQAIRIQRSLNSRKFFNEIIFDFDFDDDGEFVSKFRFLDSDSFNLLKTISTLTIPTKGSRTDLLIDVTSSLNRRARFLLSRYGKAAVMITLKTNWEVGNKIEAGDVIALDGAGLSLANWNTGDRNFGVQLFEVVERNLNIKTGQAALRLIAGIGSGAEDRFATISPSSRIRSGATVARLPIKDSYSAADPIFPNNERRKWVDYVGLPIRIHTDDYSFDETVTLTGFAVEDNSILLVNPPLSVPPAEDTVINIPKYSTSLDSTVESLYKAVHAHISPTVTVDVGTSDTVFDVPAGEETKFFVGSFVRVHSDDFVRDSGTQAGAIRVTDVTGVTITVDKTLGFTPSVGDFIQLIGFPDQGGAYRII